MEVASMSDGMKFRVKRSTGCCKTISTVVDAQGHQEVVTIDLGSGKITYGPEDAGDAAMLEKAQKPEKSGAENEEKEPPEDN